MTIEFHPRAGCVLMCDFYGYVEPEIIKARPIVIVSPKHISRGGLYTVIPLSTTAPDPVEKYHYKLLKDPIPNSNEEVWAKCDMVCTVCVERLDRFKVGHRAWKTSAISDEELAAIQACMKYALGIN